ncbi:MAG: cytochrome P460 family protein [Proteobacteria bacterium]|nr:cytochrome P460 family protein [Pseudomonadota bacterium]
MIHSSQRLLAVIVLGVLAMAGSLSLTADIPESETRSAAGQPDYTPDEKLKFPADYREWVFLTSGLDMSYNTVVMDMGGSTFDNVFVTPEAYAAFKKTGQWPQGTQLVKEARAASQKGSINRHGHFQRGEPVEVEVHVKDARFPGGWAFFIFASHEPATRVPEAAACYDCHRRNAAVDTTFVQFYPTLLPVANAFGEARGALDPK